MVENYFQQIFTLLNTNTGSLAYHLVLSFTIIGALLVAIYHSRPADASGSRRLVLGLSLLLALQMVLFLAAALAWTGFLDSLRILPFLDRAVILLSLLIVVWLWAFPERNRSTDTAMILIGLILLTVISLGIVWYINLGNQVTLQETPLEQFADLIAIGLLITGILLLAVRRPAGWIAGAAMLAILLAGYGLLWLYPAEEGSYQGAVRLAMMAAFPLVFLLPMRNWTQPGMPAQGADSQNHSLAQATQIFPAESYQEAVLIQAFMSGMLEASPDQACLLVNKTVTEYLQADVSLLIFPSSSNDGKLSLQCGYDRAQDLPIAGKMVDRNAVPVLFSALRQGRATRLPSRSTSPDLIGIAQILGLNQCGSLMFAPVLSPDGKPWCGVVVASPYSGQNWNTEDQSRLARITRPLVQFLQLKQQVSMLQKELAESRAAARLAQSRAEVAEGEYQRLQRSESGSPADPSMEALRDEYRRALAELETLKTSRPVAGVSPTATPVDSQVVMGTKES
jgi:hypothetical protein